MRLPFLTTFLIFIVILTIQLKRNRDKMEKLEESFWDREIRANSTRRKDIDNLDYIEFNPAALPLHTEIDDINLQQYISDLLTLEGKKILNCTGISNTDLKLMYGAPNITRLTEYDQNYTVLVRNIAFIANKYLIHVKDEAAKTGVVNAALRADAVTLLEYGILVKTDVRLNYELLGEIYADSKDYEKIKNLMTIASSLNSLSKEPILRFLKGLLPEEE